MLERQRRQPERHAPQRTHTRPGRAQRAGYHGVVSAPVTGSETSRPASTATAKLLLEALLGERRGSRRHADLVGAGDDPGRRLALDGRGGDEPRAGAQRAHRLAVGVEHDDGVAGAGRPGEDAGRRRAALEPAGDGVAPHVGPAADDHAQHLLPRRLLEHRARHRLHARVQQAGGDLVARALGVARADEADGEALALEAGRERLGERADHRRDALGSLPVVVVPPHALAGRHATLGRPHGRLDAVHVVEPVDPAAVGATAADAVDLLHEPAAVARVDLVAVLQQPHHGVALGGGLLLGALVQRLAAEVARDGERGVAAGGALTEAAARRKRGNREQREKEQPPHRTVTVTGNARTEPARLAVSRRRPVCGPTVSTATPCASVVAVAEPSRTAAPALATPRP